MMTEANEEPGAETGNGTAGGAMDLSNPFSAVPIEITISVGRARPLIRDLLGLRQGAVLPLDARIEDPVDLYIGERLVARGEIEELEGDQQGQLAVRLTEVADLKDGLG